jgi:hypothetical protein
MKRSCQQILKKTEKPYTLSSSCGTIILKQLSNKNYCYLQFLQPSRIKLVSFYFFYSQKGDLSLGFKLTRVTGEKFRSWRRLKQNASGRRDFSNAEVSLKIVGGGHSRS